MKIKQFETDSLAQEAGFRIGDDIIKINGHPIRDIIDYRFHISDEELEIEVDRQGEPLIFEIEKDYDDNLGIVFEDTKFRLCGNKCVFCFIDQNPPGLRKSLYVKDEDYRLSFLYGNYVTLTNISRRDLDRIVQQRLSPLYISVHSTNLEIRKRMLGIKKDDRLLEKIRFLIDHHIEIHAQIVLCPNFNDGVSLINTIHDLSQFYPLLKSVAVVPVGLTGHREKLPTLRAVSREDSQRVISELEQLAGDFKKQRGDYFVYLADEFYLKAEEQLPAKERYDEFPQIENGVGMTRSFIDQFQEQNQQLPHRIPHRKSVTLVTGKLAAPILEKWVLPRLNRIENLQATLSVVENKFFGESVTVSGLLTGKDILARLKQGPMGDTIVLPANCINFDGIFLDDWTPKILEKQLNRRIEILDDDFVSLIEDLVKQEQGSR